MRCGSHLGSEPPLVPPCQTTSSNLAHSETPAIDKSLGGFFPSTTSVIEKYLEQSAWVAHALLQVITCWGESGKETQTNCILGWILLHFNIRF